MKTNLLKQWKQNVIDRKSVFLLSLFYVIAEILIMLILRFAFRGFGLSDILVYVTISVFFLCVILCLYGVFDRREPAKIALMIFNAYSIYILGERMITDISMEVLYWPYWFNVIVLLSAMFILYAISNSVTFGIVLIDSFYLIISIVNAAIRQFRGRSLDAIDFYSISTAMKVADSYRFQINAGIVFGSLLSIGLIVFSWYILRCMKCEKKNRILAWLKRGVLLVTGSLFFIIVYQTDCLERNNYTPAYSSDRNGLVFNLLYELKYLKLEEPDGYSVEAIEELVADYEQSDSISEFDITEAPNVVVIMNESFSDFDALGELNTNIEVLPFVQNWNENVIKGYAYSSIYAGNTAVSEYEFLTGDSNILYNTMPYSTLIQTGTSPRTLVSNMKELGYTCIAMHPYYNSAYRRVPVYQTFGFDEALFIDEMENLEYLRGFATDASQYCIIYDMFEEKDVDERLFLFNVTMQNHGDYKKDDSEFEEHIILTECAGEYPEAEQYLSCVHESDKALEELILYFSALEEPTIVLVFGDHQPGIEQGFYEYLLQFENGDIGLEKYIVPYYIWANYDIDTSVSGNYISINYLSAILKQTASLPLTGYDKYLLCLQEYYPVISASCLMNAEGQMLGFQNMPEMLKAYKYMMYNHMCDMEHMMESFFAYEE